MRRMRTTTSRSGFTIMELTIVMGLMVLLTGLILPNWNAGQKQLALQRATHKLAQDIRRTQERVLAAEQFQGLLPSATRGYGLYFDKNEPDHYIIFFDQNGNQAYDSGTDGLVENVMLEGRVSIQDISASPLTIVFVPPEPKVIINPAGPAFVSLLPGEAPSGSKSVCINNLGLIQVAGVCFSNQKPVASSCTASPDTAATGSPQTFTLQATANDPDGTVVSYCWGWGDGTPEESCALTNPINRTHSYSSDGNYKPTLYVVDDEGAKSSAINCNQIKVSAAVAGNITGYAWSENIGWIDFCPNPSGLGPVGTHSACAKLGTNKLSGWAKVVNTGGWISFDCADVPGCTSDYKVQYNQAKQEFKGYAWSEDFGWVCFNKATCGGPISFKVTFNNSTKEFEGWAWSENIGWISFNCKNTNTCGTIDYKVKQQ